MYIILFNNNSYMTLMDSRLVCCKVWYPKSLILISVLMIGHKHSQTMLIFTKQVTIFGKGGP